MIPETDGKMHALYHYIGLGTWQDAAWYRSLTDPNTIEDIEVFINEHRQHHPEVPDEQGEASHMHMINLLHGIGNEVAAPKKNGKKMKKGKLIPVQTTAIGRRENQNSGRGQSTKGRRVKDQPKSLKEGL